MKYLSPWQIIGIGFILVVLGWVGPFLMAIRLIPPNFWLGFLSYGLSVLGLFLGLIGSALYISSRK